MPFWTKSEDPWDYEPEKPSRPAEPGPEESKEELRRYAEQAKELM